MGWSRRTWLKVAAAAVTGEWLILPWYIGRKEALAIERDQAAGIEIDKENLFGESRHMTDTRGFDKAAESNPHLSRIRKCVGQLLCGDEPVGSCVLLDDRTVVMSAHQLEGRAGDFRVSILRAPNDYVAAELNDFVFDRAHDLAFATIVDQGFSKKNGLVPARMAETIEKGSDIVILGFPLQLRKLHATNGSAGDIVEAIEVRGGQVSSQYCKAEGHVRSHRGMSGGGVFCANRFLGILNASNLRPQIFFTPVDLIRKAYLELYPDRAREAGIKALPDTASRPMLPACDIGRRNFLALRPTQG